MAVKIEQTQEGIIVRLPASMNIFNLQELIDRFEFLDILSRSKATEEHLNELVAEAKPNWSQDIKNRLSGMDEFKDLF